MTHPGKTVLVVDDDSATRNLITLVLREGGYGVLEAADSRTAVDLHQRNPGKIDLLLTDVFLPGGPGGCELAADIRRSKPELPVLFMSGFGVELNDFEGRAAGASQFLQKPFGIEELLRRVQDLSKQVAQVS